MRLNEIEDEDVSPKAIEKVVKNAFTGKGWAYSGKLPKLYIKHEDVSYFSTDPNYNGMYQWGEEDTDHFYLAISAYVTEQDAGIVIQDAYAGKWKGEGVFKRIIGDMTTELKMKDSGLSNQGISLIIKNDTSGDAWRNLAHYYSINYVSD